LNNVFKDWPYLGEKIYELMLMRSRERERERERDAEMLR
tara:strand:- start:250 stop:366 length:117 start_codon:yes stop_codon:yes gene_type:complete